MLLFLGNVWLALIVLANIVLIDMELLAVMYVWNINLTNVSIILLLLSIGLAVDSCAHIAHGFSTATEVRRFCVPSYRTCTCVVLSNCSGFCADDSFVFNSLQ
jgi:hypothetical protein